MFRTFLEKRAKKKPCRVRKNPTKHGFNVIGADNVT